jgi:hypothetical protein
MRCSSAPRDPAGTDACAGSSAAAPASGALDLSLDLVGPTLGLGVVRGLSADPIVGVEGIRLPSAGGVGGSGIVGVGRVPRALITAPRVAEPSDASEPIIVPLRPGHGVGAGAPSAGSSVHG